VRLVALVDIQNSVGPVPAGQVFACMDPELVEVYIRAGQARPEYAERKPSAVAGLDWPGATVVCIASGPTLSKADCERVRSWRSAAASGPERRVIVINTSFRLAPFADVLYACDSRWWRSYLEEARATCGAIEFWTQSEGVTPVEQGAGVRVVNSLRGPGLSKKKGVIHQGGNSGYQAVGLAHQAGAAKIVLLGYDMHDRGGAHWHGPHPSGLAARSNFRRWIHDFKQLAADLESAGVEVFNASSTSDLDCFPKASLEEALA
jgi:hypothetical protein